MIFTIDNDNDIRVHETEAQAEEAAKAAAGTIVVRNEKELAKVAAEWPASRLVEVWSTFAGVAPFYRLQAGQEVREPRQGGRAHLGHDPAAREGHRAEAGRGRDSNRAGKRSSGNLRIASAGQQAGAA